ncbi:hypothetical protein DRH27_00830 [Candidatus Falkowbacteria bacterium]|nr:MAG: hypothetical protein DRH27_00830 [Candidatus Falkowbacteria bacterium]
MAKFRKIFDAHVHFRKGEVLLNIIGLIVKYCFAAVAMGNTKPPYSAGNIKKNRKIIKEAAAKHGNKSFNTIMTVMMIVGITKEDVKKAFDNGARVIKLIPGDTSTGSKGMVALKDLWQYYDVLRYAALLGMKFSIHCELAFDPCTGKEIPDLEREVRAIPYLDALVKHVKGLVIIVEHISTKALLYYVLSALNRVKGTITTHHLFGLYNMVCDKNGKIINPKNFCKPILKFLEDMFALQDAVLAGFNKIFFGSDLAWHPRANKDLRLLKGKKPKAGISCPHEIAIPLIWKLFHDNYINEEEVKQRFNAFMSGYGSLAYGLKPSQEEFSIIRQRWIVPEEMASTPVFWGGRELEWKIED